MISQKDYLVKRTFRVPKSFQEMVSEEWVLLRPATSKFMKSQSRMRILAAVINLKFLQFLKISFRKQYHPTFCWFQHFIVLKTGFSASMNLRASFILDKCIEIQISELRTLHCYSNDTHLSLIHVLRPANELWCRDTGRFYTCNVILRKVHLNHDESLTDSPEFWTRPVDIQR